MRVILIAIVALLVGCGLFIGNESRASQATQYARQTFTVSKQGTLLEVIDADGRGRKKVTGDGFKLNYKTQGKSGSVSAIETKTKRLQTLSESAKYDGNKATAVVQTADNALEITSELTFDANAGELIIKRKFRNISKHPVILRGVWNHIDPKVVVRGQFNQSAKLVLAALAQITAGLTGNPPNDCDIGACPTPPVCPVCPPLPNPNMNCYPGYLTSRLYPSEKVVLGWSEPITLKPKLLPEPGGEVFIAIRILIK